MKNIVQGLWIGQSLSTMEQLSIMSYLENGCEYHLYTYEDVAGIPPRVILKDANEILPSSMIFQYREHRSYAGFSNYFRYKLLLEKGGWWSDLDIICLKPLTFDADYVFASEQNMYNTEVATSGIAKAPQGAEILEMAWTICTSKDTRKLKWGETGPELMDELIKKFSLHRYVQSAATFCPIPPHRFYEALFPGHWVTFDERTFTVHLWNEMWRRLSLDKDEIYAPKCLYERLKRMYLYDPEKNSGTIPNLTLSSTIPALPEIHRTVQE